MAAELHLLDLQTRLDQAEAAYEYTNDYLKYLLQIEGEVVIRPTDEMMVSEVETGNLEQVPDTRSDLLALMSRRMGAEKMLRASRFQYVPNLNARFAYEWNDATAFGTAADNYLLGVSLRWRLFDGARRLSTIQQRKAELDKVRIEYNEQKETADLELRKARRQMEIASNRLKTTDIALKRAEDLYRIKRNRFGEGMEKVEDLLNAESVFFSKRIERLQAMYQHQITVYTLEFLLEQNING